MELNKENMRKIRELILFTALLIVVLWKYEEVLEVLGYVGHLIFPFLLGGAIAFVDVYKRQIISLAKKELFKRRCIIF